MYLLEIVSVGVIGIELPLKMDQSESDVGRNEAGSLENFGVWLICFYSGTSKQNLLRVNLHLSFYQEIILYLSKTSYSTS
jgi:hypothetical protein